MAGTPLEEVRVRLAADTKGFITGVDTAVNQAVTKVQAFGKAVDAAGAKMSNAGRTMTMGLTAPILALGGAAFKFGSDFGETLDHIVGLAGVARDQVNAWKKDIYDISRATAKGPGELAEALYFITSAGIKGAAAMETLRAAAYAAAAGLGETQVVADAVTSVLNAYGVSTISAAQATAVLVGAVREGKGEANEFAPAIGRVIPIASQLGVSFDQVAAAIAAMTRTGLSADEAVTALRGIFTELVQGGGQGAEVLAKVGLSAEALQKQLREEGLLAVLRTLSVAFKGNMTDLSMFIGNVRALTGFMTITGQSADMINGIFAALANTTEEDLATAFDAVAEGPGFRMRQALNLIRVELVRLGDEIGPIVAGTIAPAFAQVTTVLGFLVDKFEKLPPVAQKAIMGVALLVASLGPLLMIVGSVASGVSALIALAPVLGGAFAALAGPVGLALAAVAGLVAVFIALRAQGVNVQAYMQPFIGGLAALRDAAVATVDALASLVSGLSQLGIVAPPSTAATLALGAGLVGLLMAINPLLAVLAGAGGLIWAIGLFRTEVRDLPKPLQELRLMLDKAALGYLALADAILQVLDLQIGPIDLTPWTTPVDVARQKIDEAQAAILGDMQLIQAAFDDTSAATAEAEVLRLTGVVVDFGNACVLSVQQYAAMLGVAESEAARRYAMQYGPAPKAESMAEELARKYGIGAYKAKVVVPTPGAGVGGGTGAAAKQQAVAYTETLDELTETLLGLGRAAGMTDKQLAGYPWTLELARRAAERLGLSTDDLLDIFKATGKGFGDFMRALAASESLDQLKQIADAVVSSLTDLQSQFNALFAAPTKEQAAINYQLAQLKLRRAQMVATGATDEALAGIDREIQKIENVNAVRQAEVDVMRAQLDMANKTLLTDAEQYAQAGTLVQKMADLSAAAQPVIDLYRTQAELMQGWMDSLGAIIFMLAALPLPAAQIPTAQYGGIVPGPRGQPQLIMANAGEEIMPLGGSRSFAMPVTVNIEGGADWMEITRRAHQAVTDALHEARQRSYLQGAPLGSAIG